jgi:hypothetical protein
MNWASTQDRLRTGVLLLAVSGLGLARTCAEWEVVREAQPQAVFGGGKAPIQVMFHNSGDQTAASLMRCRLLQTTSATAVPVNEMSWKKIQAQPGQTIVEFADLDFPDVKGETRFLIQWLEDTNRVIGSTEVWVHPTNVLTELKTLAGEEPLGVFDPGNELKPLLKALKVDFLELEQAGLGVLSGRLAIVGPFQPQAQMPEGLANRIQTSARKGVAVVWIQPPPPQRLQTIKPSFYTVQEGKGAVVIVQASLVAHLAERPEAQWNLLQFARMALRPEPVSLPYLTP